MVSIIVTTSNFKKHLPKLFKSITKQCFDNFELIVVEHGVQKTTAINSVSSKLRNKVKILGFSENMGFCKANNIAAQKAQRQYLFFINDDVILGTKCLASLVARFKKEGSEQLAVVQPKLRSSKYPTFFEYAGAAGGLIDKYGYPFCRGRVLFTLEEDKGQYDQSVEIFWATGAAFFVRKDLFLEFGGFDERFFAYHEETDLCWRLKNAGYKIFFEPEAVVYHKGATSWKKRNFLRTFLIHRNHFWMLAKNNSLFKFVKLLPGKILLDWAAFFYYLLHRGFASTVAALLGSLIGLVLTPRFVNWSFSDMAGEVKINQNLFYPGSVVYEYFLKGKKTYQEVMGKRPPLRVKTRKYREFFNRD